MENSSLPVVAIVGAGASGCMCASVLSSICRGKCRIVVLDRGASPLAKVAITGGGRCNLTNTFEGIERLVDAYPRGERLLRKVFSVFGPQDTLAWFRKRGVEMSIQPDGCVFPLSQKSSSITGALLFEMKKGGVEIVSSRTVVSIEKTRSGFRISHAPSSQLQGSNLSEQLSVESLEAMFVLVSSGGTNHMTTDMLSPLNLAIIPPVPSLFTLRIEDGSLRSLMGLVVNGGLSIVGTKFSSRGAILITDWGISGPATLKLSSYAARYLSDSQYLCAVRINWTEDLLSEQDALSYVTSLLKEGGNERRMVRTVHPPFIQARLWEHLLSRASLREDITCAEIGKKGLSRVARALCADEYPVAGRAAFRDEMVTCGGVALGEVDPSTLESRIYPGLYFSGEVLDIDAITGGFNLQAAWSTGYLAARSIASSLGAWQ